MFCVIHNRLKYHYHVAELYQNEFVKISMNRLMNNPHTALPPTENGLTGDRLPVYVRKCQEDNIWIATQRYFFKFHPLTNAASCESSHDSILRVKEKQTTIVGERWQGLCVRQIFFASSLNFSQGSQDVDRTFWTVV